MHGGALPGQQVRPRPVSPCTRRPLRVDLRLSPTNASGKKWKMPLRPSGNSSGNVNGPFSMRRLRPPRYDEAAEPAGGLAMSSMRYGVEALPAIVADADADTDAGGADADPGARAVIPIAIAIGTAFDVAFARLVVAVGIAHARAAAAAAIAASVLIADHANLLHRTGGRIVRGADDVRCPGCAANGQRTDTRENCDRNCPHGSTSS